MQAQAYAMAKWAIGLRWPEATDAAVEQAFNDGAILRTHLLRPTWHFVVPADIRWLLALTAPQVHRRNGTMYRRTELDAATLRAACHVIEQALSGRRQLTRQQLAEHLATAGIEAASHRLSYIMMYAELEGLICSGPRVGKQFTYELLDEFVPPGPVFSRAEAIATLARRYFATRCPASIRDFAVWSGLSLRDARAGAATLGPDLSGDRTSVDNLLFIEGQAPMALDGASTFLMPIYDEYGSSYINRAALQHYPNQLEGASPYNNWLVCRGAIVGTWQSVGQGHSLITTATPLVPLAKDQMSEIDAAIDRYRRFVGPA
jgi:hypothetical protein